MLNWKLIKKKYFKQKIPKKPCLPIYLKSAVLKAPTATSSGVLPSPSLASNSAPFLIKYSAIFWALGADILSAISCSGVLFRKFFVLISAPFLWRSFTIWA